MHVFACICTDMTSVSRILLNETCIYVQHTFNIRHRSYILRVHCSMRAYLHVYWRILTVFRFKYVHIHTVTVRSRLLRVHLRRRRSLHLRCAVATASLSRCIASAGRSPNSIRSGLRDRTAEAGGILYRRAPAARWSAMAIVVTTEQRRPGDCAFFG